MDEKTKPALKKKRRIDWEECGLPIAAIAIFVVSLFILAVLFVTKAYILLAGWLIWGFVSGVCMFVATEPWHKDNLFPAETWVLALVAFAYLLISTPIVAPIATIYWGIEKYRFKKLIDRSGKS